MEDVYAHLFSFSVNHLDFLRSKIRCLTPQDEKTSMMESFLLPPNFKDVSCFLWKDQEEKKKENRYANEDLSGDGETWEKIKLKLL